MDFSKNVSQLKLINGTDPFKKSDKIVRDKVRFSTSFMVWSSFSLSRVTKEHINTGGNWRFSKSVKNRKQTDVSHL